MCARKAGVSLYFLYWYQCGMRDAGGDRGVGLERRFTRGSTRAEKHAQQQPRTGLAFVRCVRSYKSVFWEGFFV